ncbi:DUF881 domain-containing protein [Peribacillus huizhouensis]|uniref:Uncharacterized protein YlxW (UPF0749 family) n=1 Tax=Peribacillus huizhouensis TaxID=1501239 RepID=A0ABR6CK27_9BACI|nr:DUF881 domain-containing protein [Peribacillus huizhouensis]MBA9024958.1 uncharacterized protein YlxW (UPF0749 family) [Peribacillus huizhouensis]
MKKRNKIAFTLIAVIVGFMVAIQFNTIKEPSIKQVKDTRDSYELRSGILKEQKVQTELVKEIRNLEEKLAQYETTISQSKEQVLSETLEELRSNAGMTSVSGKGIIITIKPIEENILLGENVQNVSPDLLKRLLNELYQYDAKEIAVNGQRIITTSVIRDINGQTKIDGKSISRDSIEIRVLAENAQKLKERIQVSETIDNFYVDNYEVTITNPLDIVTLPPYQNSLKIQYMEPIDE